MLTIRILRTHLRRRAAELLAAPLVRRDGALAAAKAMQHLNAYAKDNLAWAETIYTAKTDLIRAFCRLHPGRVMRNTKTRACRGYFDRSSRTWSGCKGRGCEKCGGDGVYGTLDLLLFCFEIGGEEFLWHELQSRVDWPIETVPVMRFRGTGRSFVYTTLSTWDAELMYATVRIYLEREAGVTVRRTRITLRDAFAADVAKMLLWTSALLQGPGASRE